MSELSFVTRGMHNPQGLPRVYFCCHSEDFPRYFEMLSKEILEKANCAIWYPENQDAKRDDEYLDNLREMQLFVMPVTSALLLTDNAALRVEFKYAVENHIPVLPIMMEGSLTAEFNIKCGDLQYLDKFSKDDTAISYDEKLTRFLEAVLIGDEMAQKVRDAFDAYIFLSYRKKDRKQAQELMRLIHRNEFCRDIAIWYDEFLTPGEDFNDNIGRALNKSQLFALAVTPNLVNEENYVQSTEYPMAVDAGKIIIPAEIVPTDRALLSEKFRGIEQVVDAHDEAMLSDALLSALEKIAIKENDNSPEHSFFIGLAYLGGIDVEVDYNKALALITFAAESGLSEAAGKLVEMYRKGIGVDRDYHTAVQWQEQKIALLEAEYKKNPNVEALYLLFWQIVYCGDFYKDLGKYNEAKDKYLRAISYVKRCRYPDKDKMLYRNLIKGYARTGVLLQEQFSFRDAMKYYSKALRRSKRLCYNKSERKKSDIFQLVDILIGINNVLLQQNPRVYQVRSNCTKCIKLLDDILYNADVENLIEKLSAEDEDWVYWFITYNNMGDILRADKDFQRAQEYYDKALKIVRSFVQNANSDDARIRLITGYNNMGDILGAQSDYQSSLEYFREAIKIARKLIEETNTVQARMLLSVCYYKIGEMYESQGDFSEAKRYYVKSLEIRENVAEDTDSAEFRHAELLSCLRIGNAFKELKNKQGMLRNFRKAIAIGEDITNESDVEEYRSDLAKAYMYMGHYLFICGENGALEYSLKAYRIFEKIGKKTEVKKYRELFSMNCLSISILYRNQTRWLKSFEYRIKSEYYVIGRKNRRRLIMCAANVVLLILVLYRLFMR